MPLADPTNADVNLVLPDPFDFSDPDFWKEDTDNRSPASDAMSYDSAATTLVAEVPWGSRWACLLNALGWSYSDNNGLRLVRKLPVNHPYWTHLRATKLISCVGKGFRGTEEAFNDIQAMQTSVYEKAIMTFQFDTAPFNVLNDEQVSFEWERYLEFRMESKTEFLCGQGIGSWKFCESQPGTSKPAGIAFSRDINLREQRAGFTLIWHDVPWDFFMGFPDGGNVSSKILSAVARVNSTTFLGCPKDTLLLLDPTFDIKVVPIETNWPGRPKYHATIALPFIYFNPTNLGNGFAGHQCKPYRGEADSPGATYYGITSDGQAGGPRLYGEYDFNQCFTHWNA